jgi:signal transduction histidine kinase
MNFKLSRIELQALKDFFDGKLMEEIEMFLQNSLFSAKQITTLINDLLDLAKLEKGQFTFNNEFFNLKETIGNGIQ